MYDQTKRGTPSSKSVFVLADSMWDAELLFRKYESIIDCNGCPPLRIGTLHTTSHESSTQIMPGTDSSRHSGGGGGGGSERGGLLHKGMGREGGWKLATL